MTIIPSALASGHVFYLQRLGSFRIINFGLLFILLFPFDFIGLLSLFMQSIRKKPYGTLTVLGNLFKLPASLGTFSTFHRTAGGGVAKIFCTCTVSSNIYLTLPNPRWRCPVTSLRHKAFTKALLKFQPPVLKPHLHFRFLQQPSSTSRYQNLDQVTLTA